MSQPAWYQSKAAFLLMCLLLPPVGFVLLWFRGGRLTGKLA